MSLPAPPSSKQGASKAFAIRAARQVHDPELRKIFEECLQLAPGQMRKFKLPKKYRGDGRKIESMRRNMCSWFARLPDRIGFDDRWYSTTVSTLDPTFVEVSCEPYR